MLNRDLDKVAHWKKEIKQQAESEIHGIQMKPADNDFSPIRKDMLDTAFVSLLSWRREVWQRRSDL